MPVPSYLNFPQDPLPPKILPQLFRNPVTTETFHQISQLQAKYALYVDSGIFSSEAFLQVFTPDVSTNYGLTLGEIQGVENLRRVIHDSSQYFGVSQHNVGTHVMGEHEDGEGVWCLTYVNTHNWMKGDDTQVSQRVLRSGGHSA